MINPATKLPFVLDGLDEFQEHLGGELTISMLSAIGKRFDIHEVDNARYLQAIDVLRVYSQTKSLT